MTQQEEEASHGAPWWRSRGLPLLASAAKWLAVLVVASLMVPALTSQWSDRQKELDVKNAVVAQITHSAATATQDAYSLVDDESKSAMPSTSTTTMSSNTSALAATNAQTRRGMMRQSTSSTATSSTVSRAEVRARSR